MQVLEHEKPLTAWLETNHSEILGAYEGYLGVDLNEVYSLDLRTWLHREHPEILSEYAEVLRTVIPVAKALFTAIKGMLQKFDDGVEANASGTPMLGSECWAMAQHLTVRALEWKGWLGTGPKMLLFKDDWLENIFGIGSGI